MCEIYSIVSPYKQSIYIADSTLLLALNHYLGAEHKVYDGFEEYIKKTRDKIVNKLCPVGDHNRGTQDYIRNLKQANMIAEIIEALCYQMVNYGYKLKSESV